MWEFMILAFTFIIGILLTSRLSIVGMRKYKSRPRKGRSPLQKAHVRTLAVLRLQKKAEAKSGIAETGAAECAGSEPPAQRVQRAQPSKPLNDFGFLTNLVKEKTKEAETQRNNYKRAKQRESSANSKIEKLQKKIDSLEEQLMATRKARDTAQSVLRELAGTRSYSSRTLVENASSMD